MAGENQPLRILVVCTANQCRSPLTAAMIARRAAESGVELVVTSAGTQAVDGMPATPPTIDAARKLGVDLSRHQSAPLDLEAVRNADLIIGLERRHVQDIVVTDPRAFARSFTLKELTRRGAAVGGRGANQAVAEWLTVVHHGRRATDLLGVSDNDDVTDPTGSRAMDHRRTAEEIDALATDLLKLLFDEE